jgi:hypothetical protein
MSSSPRKIPFDPSTADLETTRQIVFARLRADREWRQVDQTGDGFSPWVEYPADRNGRWRLVSLANEVFWLLVAEGILSPGMDYHNPDLRWFHITDYGRYYEIAEETRKFLASNRV